MTWNVQHAAPARARRQAAWLASCGDADVLVLTEVRDSVGGQALIQALREHGYQVIVPDSAAGDYLAVVATGSAHWRRHRSGSAICRHGSPLRA